MALYLPQSRVMQHSWGMKVALPSSAKPCIIRHHSTTSLSWQWQPRGPQHVRPAPACPPPQSSSPAASPGPSNEPGAPRPALLQFLHNHSRTLVILASLALLAALASLALPNLTHHASAALPPTPAPSPPVTSATLQLATAAKWINAVPDLLRQQLDGAITRLSAAPLGARLLSMFLIGVPIIIPLGHLYSRASGLDLRTATLKMYALLYRAPGGSIITDQANAALLIANCTYFAGVFVFAVLLGFVGDDVKSRIKAVRSGTYALHLQHHMLVLNWNRNTVPLLRQMAAAQKDPESPFFKCPVVVMSGRPKAEMQEELATGLRGYDMEVHTRTGTPFRVSDLRRVNAADAGAVIMLQPSQKAVAALGGAEASEAVKAATLMTLFSSPGEKCQATRLVVQSSPGPPSEVDVLRAVSKSSGLEGRLQVLRTDDRVIANRLLAQTAMQPGLASVYNEIVQQGAGRARALFVPLPPSLEALTYRDVRRRYPAAVVLGYIPAGAAKKLVLNPADHVVLNKGDRLLLLSRTGAVQPAPEAEATYVAAAGHARAWATSSRPSAVKARRIIVAGWWLKDLPLLLDSLAEFAPRGSSVTVVTEEVVGKDLMKARGNCRFTSIVARHPTAVQTLREAGVKEASAVLVGGLERATDVESEARVLAALVQVQEACQLEGRKDAPHVVAKVRQPNTSKVARQYLQAVVPARAPTTARRAAGPARTPSAPSSPIPVPSAEFLLPEEFFSAIISQVAADPDYQLLIQELLGSAEGQEVYIHPASQYYMDPGMTVAFADVEEAVRVKGQTALGLLLREGRCMLVPGAGCSLKLREGDSIVVLAEDYHVVTAHD